MSNQYAILLKNVPSISIGFSLQINVSNQTVRRCLKEWDMKAKTKIKKPLLSANHKRPRELDS